MTELPSRDQGATLVELTKVSGWQPHSVHAFLAGTVWRKMQLPLTSETVDGVCRYRIDATARVPS